MKSLNTVQVSNTFYSKLNKSRSFKENLLAFGKGFKLPIASKTSNIILDTDNCFIHNSNYNCNVWRALCPDELPLDAIYLLKPINTLGSKPFASVTGPNTGLLVYNKWKNIEPNENSKFIDIIFDYY